MRFSPLVFFGFTAFGARVLMDEKLPTIASEPIPNFVQPLEGDKNNFLCNLADETMRKVTPNSFPKTLENAGLLNPLSTPKKYPTNFLDKRNTETIETVTPSSILNQLFDISNSTTGASLEKTLRQAKKLNETQLTSLAGDLNPPLYRYLRQRGLNISKALDEGYAYMRSNHFTDFEELFKTLDPDTQLAFNLMLDKLEDLKKHPDILIPAIIILAVVTLVSCAAYHCDKRADQNSDRSFSLLEHYRMPL